jgi:hypothetical protein
MKQIQEMIIILSIIILIGVSVMHFTKNTADKKATENTGKISDLNMRELDQVFVL